MTITTGEVTEDVASTIAIGQSVYDNEGTKVGSVDGIDRDTGYMVVLTSPFSEKYVSVPFRLVTNIDPRELYLANSSADIHRDYASPPARSTTVENWAGRETATTTEASGYDGEPVVVDKARIDHLKRCIEIGDHVFTSDMADLGRIEEYDQGTGWMTIQQGPISKSRMMVPVAVVYDVNRDMREVYLSESRDDLKRYQRLESVNAVAQ